MTGTKRQERNLWKGTNEKRVHPDEEEKKIDNSFKTFYNKTIEAIFKIALLQYSKLKLLLLSTAPSYLRLSPMDKRKKFLHITALGDQRIEEAFSTPKTSVWSVNEALKKSNLYKNRYSNVFPYDKTRVRLPVEKGSEDYINASYVTLDQNEYIAAQGPLTDTIHHFWAMAYNESEKQNNDTVVIAMVTPLTESGIVKCTQYWPDKTQISFDLSENILEDRISIPGGSLKVEYVQESYNAVGDYLLTELLLKSDTKVKKVYHYYYFKWADAKVPPSLSPLVCLSKEIRSVSSKVENKEKGIQRPTPIVHCSAGVGRTGTFIAIDHLFNDDTLEEAHKNPQEDPVFQTVLRLRNCRMMMVQTLYQYDFLYESAEKWYRQQLTQ